ncbi:hypothetical protein V499_08936 [Pseudogymnoascus sp. VKM F-103]|nr:hypothetical protein V499_08936 [Pseudogymnoascus sp. VKM F-103]
MMQPHNQQRHRKTDPQIHPHPPPLPRPRRVQFRILHIQHPSQGARDGHGGGGDPDGDGPHDLDFDVAQDGAVPPGGEVVVGPEEGVDEDHEVEEGEVED